MNDNDKKGAYGVVETASLLAEGMTVRQVADSAAARMTSPDACPGVWAHLDVEGLLRQAAALDARLAGGEKPPPLAGAVFGVKDVFDVLGMPTRSGTALTPARPAAEDSELVRRLRRAGALIAGKTSMPEFSLGATPGAVNPRDRARTPGSSSSGTAAAVADRQAAFAVGVQTNASLIRPAAFCGVYAFKPSRGTLPTEGMLCLTPALDQPGYMANSLEDIDLLHQIASGGEISPEQPPRPLAWTRTPWWEQASPAMRAGLERLAAAIGAIEMELPPEAAAAPEALQTVMHWQLAESLTRMRVRDGDLTPPLREAARRGREAGQDAYTASLITLYRLTRLIDRTLSPWSGVLCPAAPGVAPRLSEGTGSPIFSSLWSLAGAPCLGLPLLDEDGLPLGLQLVGAPGRDAELLAAGKLLSARRFTIR